MDPILESSPAPESAGPGRGLIFAMACAAGIAVANIYYNQPMLGVITRSFRGGMATPMIPTVTQLGFASGLLLLVPLGDLIERRWLIMIQFLLLAVTSAVAALAPSDWVLLGASCLIGVGASVAQQVVPLAASLAAPSRRGAVVGSVMSGLFMGILLSRTLAGFVAAHWGWRAMYWLGVPMALVGASTTRWLPRNPPAVSMGYGSLLRSLLDLWREEPRLRRAACTQGLLFAAFSAFWTILALHLEQPPLSRGADIAGLFGIIGATGVMAAPFAGRLADRRGHGPVVMMGAAFALLAWLVLAGWNSLAGLVVGVILLDFGVQSALIAHQHLVYGLKPEARNRINTIFMVGMFIGGSVGSSGAMLAWKKAGWRGVGGFGLLVSLLAVLAGVRKSSKGNPVTTGH